MDFEWDPIDIQSVIAIWFYGANTVFKYDVRDNLTEPEIFDSGFSGFMFWGIPE